jgi:3'-phosphoadenosine 5'-phosphosulfate sulfotransferase (PAPS reductase)/FAD synthetase
MAETGMIEVFSSGGGTQSACISAMICDGVLPRPDLAVIADTGREHGEVWRYLDGVIGPAFAEIGLEIVRVKKEEFATVDLWSKGKGGTVLPVFTANAGQAAINCSNEWKRRVIDRYLRTRGCKKSKVRKWIGFSTDEGNRYTRMLLSEDGLAGLVRFPLIQDVPTSRKGAKAYVLKKGWPLPPRSACWMCPMHSKDEWEHLKRNHPDEFEKAVLLERELREKEPNSFLHQSRVPLDQVPFDETEDMFVNHCNSGMCFV